jgi:hypothetical protein
MCSSNLYFSAMSKYKLVTGWLCYLKLLEFEGRCGHKLASRVATKGLVEFRFRLKKEMRKQRANNSRLKITLGNNGEPMFQSGLRIDLNDATVESPTIESMQNTIQPWRRRVVI